VESNDFLNNFNYFFKKQNWFGLVSVYLFNDSRYAHVLSIFFFNVIKRYLEHNNYLVFLLNLI